jgi:Tol biopolymer transport system component
MLTARECGSSPTSHLNRGPRWSPDGKRIAFFSDRSGDREIWTIDINTGEMRQITNLGGQNVAWPVWSPDGKYLAYTVFGANTFIIQPDKLWAAQSPQRLPPYPNQGPTLQRLDVVAGWPHAGGVPQSR